MAFVTDINEHRRKGGTGGPPVDLESRIKKVEQTLSDVRVEVAAVRQKLDSEMPQLVTKAELKTLEATMIKWMVGVAIGIGGLAFAVARLIK